jgi:hypothetical protein
MLVSGCDSASSADDPSQEQTAMRMMTGAILILTSVILFSVYQMYDLKPLWEWYAFAMGGIGWVFLIWGLIKDLSITLRRHRRGNRGDVES